MSLLLTLNILDTLFIVVLKILKFRISHYLKVNEQMKHVQRKLEKFILCVSNVDKIIEKCYVEGV